RGSSASTANSVSLEIQHGCTGISEGHRLTDLWLVRHHHGLWAFHPGHERRGEPRPGQPRNPASEAEKPEACRDRYRDLQLDLYGWRDAAGIDADSGWTADPDLPEQPNCRIGHVHGWPYVLASGVSRLRRVCRLPDSVGRD